jgi:hypothetical protein
MPWEIDGISMGRVPKTPRISLNLIPVLRVHRAKTQARATEITVAAAEAVKEWITACLNRGPAIMARGSTEPMLANIRSRGRRTDTKRKIPRKALKGPEKYLSEGLFFKVPPSHT